MGQFYLNSHGSFIMLRKMNTQEQDFISTVFLSLDSKEKEETQQEQIEFLDFIKRTPLPLST
jgi:hypothetical protein